MGLLDKLDKALVMLQMVQAYGRMWDVFNGTDWQSGVKNSKSDSGFITTLSNFDEAIAHLASHSWKIFSHPNVEKGMTEFIKGQLAKQKTSLLIFAPTPEKPEIKINFPARHIKIGTLSMSKTHADVYVEIGVKRYQIRRKLWITFPRSLMHMPAAAVIAVGVRMAMRPRLARRPRPGLNAEKTRARAAAFHFSRRGFAHAVHAQIQPQPHAGQGMVAVLSGDPPLEVDLGLRSEGRSGAVIHR